MKQTNKKLSETKVEIKIVLDKSDFKPALDEAIKRLAKDVKVEGFRKGKAPENLAKKSIDPNLLASTALEIAINISVPKAFDDAKFRPIVMPNINVTKYVPEDTAEFTATAEILPEIKLGDCKSLKAKMEKTDASEKDINEILENIRTSFSEKKAVKHAAKLGDEVIIDFVGKKDDKAFEGGSAKDHALLLGSKSFIPGFEEGIVGHSSGDKFDLPVTFPKDYPVKDLAGAKTVFEILLKQVNEVVKPELNSDLVKKCGPFKTVDELKADIKKNIETQNLARSLDKFKNNLVNELVEKSKVSAPEIMITDQLHLIKDDFERNAMSRGQDLKEYIEAAGEKFEDWEKEAKKVAEQRVKANLVLQTLALQEKISATEEEVEAKIAELRDVYKKSEEALKNLKDPRVKNDIKARLTIDKVLDHLVKINKK